MNKKKLISMALTAGLLLTSIVGCSQSTGGGGDTASTKAPSRITIATATTGGVYYPVGNALAQLWSQKNGVQAVAQSTAGTPQNINMMEKKEAEIAFAQNGVAYYAYNGKEMYKDRPQKNLRAISFLYPNVMHFVVKADSGINSIKDLKGKRFVPGSTGSATEVNSREILSVYGLDYREKKDLQVDYVGYNEAAEALKNNQVQGIMIAGGLPTAAVLDVATSSNVKLLSLEPEMIEKLTKEMPWYYPFTIPKGTYKGQTEDIQTVAVANILLVREDLPTDFVYNLTKTMFENLKTLADAHGAMKDLKKEDALNGLTVPLHEGAKKYFKEIGLNVDGK